MDWEEIESYLGKNFTKTNPFTKNQLIVIFDEENNSFIKGILEEEIKFRTDYNYLYSFYNNNQFRVNTQSPQDNTKEKLFLGSQVLYGKLQEEIRKELHAGEKILFDGQTCIKDEYFYEIRNGKLIYKNCREGYSIDVYQESPIYLEDSEDLNYVKAKIGDKAYVQKNGEWFEYYYQGSVLNPWISVGDGTALTSKVEDEEAFDEKILKYIPNAKDLVIRQSGGCMLANGDIFCWGNNANKKVGISTYGQIDQGLSPDFINTPIMLKTQIDNIRVGSTTYDIKSKNWYNNPYRVKFDKMSMNSTNVCGISPIFTDGVNASVKVGGDLYCNGRINSTYYEDLAVGVSESSILKRNKFFYTGKADGLNNSTEIYLKDIAMVEDAIAVLSDTGRIYTIGKNYKSALGINSSDNFYQSETPLLVSSDSGVIFKKIFALRDTRTFGAIDTENRFYIWGDRGNTIYLKPTLISNSLKFDPDAIFVNTNEFILKSLTGTFYKTNGTAIQSVPASTIEGNPISLSYYKDNLGQEFWLYIDENLKLKGSSSLLSCKEPNETTNCNSISNEIFDTSLVQLNSTNNQANSKYANFTNVSVFKLDHQISEIYEDFEDDLVGWNRQNTHNGGTQATTFLGRWASGSSATDFVNKTFNFGSENANKAITIKLDFYEIDSWDDEFFRVHANGVLVHEKRYRHGRNDGGTQITMTGITGTWGQPEKHQININTTLDSNGRVRLGFSSNLNSAISDESWGVDNIEIYRTSDSKLLARNDFEPLTGWSNTRTTAIVDNGDTTQVPATTFLGRFPSNAPCSGNPCSNESPFILTKTYTFPGFANYEVDIEFDFYEIDTWDGERFEFYANDELLAMDHFVMDGQQFLQDSNITGINLQDNIRPETGYTQDQTYRYKLRAKLNSNAQVTLKFRTSLEFTDPLYANYWSRFDEGVDNESWGLDNVRIKLRETNKKFVCAMTGVENASQMYCWGNVARSIPILSTSLYDMSKISTINKLFISQDGEKSNQMSHDEFFNDGKLFLKYPTYIGGFDYPFYFR